MGMCLPCFGGAADDVVVTPDPETRRRQLAEAAEKRQKERSHLKIRKNKTKVALRNEKRVFSSHTSLCWLLTTYRGVKNPEAVERKRKKQEEIEKQEMTTSVSGGGGLRWQVG